MDPEDASQVLSDLETGHREEGRVPVTETVQECDGTVTVIDHT
jgi:hypothetical protein